MHQLGGRVCAQTRQTASRCPFFTVKQPISTGPLVHTRKCVPLQRCLGHFKCRSSTSEPQQTTDAPNKADTGDTKIKQTLADLDALLGIQEEEKKEDNKEDNKVCCDVGSSF